MRAVSALVLAAGALAQHAEVDDYIANAHCKEHYISRHRPVCVGNGECFPHGSDDQNACTSVKMWKWPKHAPGVNPSPINRKATNGIDASQKLVWAYASDITQGAGSENKGRHSSHLVITTVPRPSVELIYTK